MPNPRPWISEVLPIIRKPQTLFLALVAYSTLDDELYEQVWKPLRDSAVSTAQTTVDIQGREEVHDDR